jgi:hypothetical protein
MEGVTGGYRVSDKELVDAVLRDLAEAADRWEALVAQSETVTYSVDMGDIQAVANSDGKLVGLTMHPGVTVGYTHTELADRLNTAFTALREEVHDDYRARYGGDLR